MKFISLIPLIACFARSSQGYHPINEMHFLFAYETVKSPLSEDEDPNRDAFFA